MTEISGPLTLVTEDAAVVTAVWVQAPALRTHGAGAILPQRARATIDAGAVVSFQCAPGPAVLIWQAGGVEDQVPILVSEEPDQSLASVVRAAQLASGRTADELAALVREVTEGVAAVTAAASSAVWDGDRLTVLGATSPPLTGPQGERGPQGLPGAAGDGTGDVLWSELNPVLAGKADVGHTHTPASIGAAPASHTHSQYAESSQVTGLENDLTTFMAMVDGHLPTLVSGMIEDKLPIIVSSLPASPLPGRIYLVTGA